MKLLTTLLATAILATQCQAPAKTCREDDPCFDCHKMGNHKCGPAIKDV